MCECVCVCVCVCARARTQSCPTLCSLPDSSVHGMFQAGYWSGLPFPPPGDLPYAGMEPVPLVSSALAGGFFTTESPGKP